MLQHEFDDLMGIVSTTEEYTLANGIYMDTDMDKQSFCREWKKMRNSPLLKEVNDKLNVQRIRLHKSEQALKEQGEKLALLGNRHNDDELRKMSREMLGNAAYVKLCLENGYTLRGTDKEFILDLLK